MVLENPDTYRVRSSQNGPHRNLARVVRGHLASDYAKPLQDHNRRAFDATCELMNDESARPVVLDAGCGDGSSTRALSRRYPEALVVGVDKSAHRLPEAAAAPVREGRVILVRADLADFWRLARAAGWRLTRHYLLYPNPWPKPGHLKRRWHGHPVWPAMLALGGELELRSNWYTYLEEFAHALAASGAAKTPPPVEPLDEAPPLTPFERKYRAAGSSCYRLRTDLNGPNPKEWNRC